MGATSLDLSQIKTDALSAASTFRTLIGLGNVNNTSDANKPISTATQTALDLKADSSALSGYQPLDSDLTSIAALSTTAFGRSLLTQADAPTTRTTLGLGTLATQSATISDYLLSATAASTYLPLAGGTLTGALAGTTISVTGNISASNLMLNAYQWIGWGGTNLLTADPDIGLRLNNVAIQQVSWLGFGSSSDLRLERDAADTLAQRRSTNAQTWRLYNTFTDASNYIRQALSFTTYSSTVHAQIAAEGAGTGAVNVPFVITPRGTGAFILGPMPDGTATGGNARGANAVDLSTASRTDNSYVASGTRAVVLGRGKASGQDSFATGNCIASQEYAVCFGDGVTGNTASGRRSFVAGGRYSSASGDDSFSAGQSIQASGSSSAGIGSDNTASAFASFAGGMFSTADRYAMRSHGSGRFAATGDAQFARFVARRKTTDAVATTLMLDGSSTRLTIPSGKMFLFEAKIVGVRSDGLRRASYIRKGTIINVAGATSIVGSIEAVGTDVEDDPNLNLTITADDTNDALDIQVTGIAGETWRWVAVVEGVEVAYGA